MLKYVNTISLYSEQKKSVTRLPLECDEVICFSMFLYSS